MVTARQSGDITRALNLAVRHWVGFVLAVTVWALYTAFNLYGITHQPLLAQIAYGGIICVILGGSVATAIY